MITKVRSVQRSCMTRCMRVFSRIALQIEISKPINMHLSEPERRVTMRRARKVEREAVIQSLLRRIALSFLTFSATTVFVLVACSARQNQSAPSNTGLQAATTDWKEVAQALGKEGSVQPGDVYTVS